MQSAHSIKYGLLGFGRTKQEAHEDLTFNIARQSLEHPEAVHYRKRREELYSWLPLPNILSIHNVTAVIYEDGVLKDVKLGNTLALEIKPLSHYLHLFQLLGSYITFEDFTVTIGKEVDLFLKNISPMFGSLRDFPYIKPGNLLEAINITNYPHGCFKCNTIDEVMVSDGNRVFSAEVPFGIDEDSIVAYCFAKLNIVYDGKEVHLCHKDPKDLTR